MKFLIDAHLPFSLARFFGDHDVVHTSELEQGNLTHDSDLNTLSVQEERILITKDMEHIRLPIASKRSLCGISRLANHLHS